MFDEILALLLPRWPELLPECAPPKRWQPVLLGKNRVILFLYEDAGRNETPLLIVKINRRPGDSTRDQRWAETLLAMRARMSPSLARTIPRCAFLGLVNGLHCWAETVVPGRPMPLPRPATPAESLSRDVAAVAKWLADLHGQTADGFWEPDEKDWQERIFAPMAACCHAPGDAEMLCALVEAASRRLSGRALTAGWGYGDANPSNFLLEDGRVSGAFDWTAGGPSRWRVVDWPYFAFFYAFSYCEQAGRRKHSTTDDAQAALDICLGAASTPIARVLQDATGRFFGGQNVDLSWLPWLYLAMLARLGDGWDTAALIRHAYRLIASQLGD